MDVGKRTNFRDDEYEELPSDSRKGRARQEQGSGVAAQKVSWDFSIALC
jgi:hypothetical protein